MCFVIKQLFKKLTNIYLKKLQPPKFGELTMAEVIDVNEMFFTHLNRKYK